VGVFLLIFNKIMGLSKKKKDFIIKYAENFLNNNSTIDDFM